MGVEIHPFEPFVPKDISHLILGSFTSKDSAKGVDYDWYYSNGRNQFWPLLEKVYGVELPEKKSKMDLFSSLRLGIADIIYKCDQKQHSSLDSALEVIEYNPELNGLIQKNLKSIFFTSRFVENMFDKGFKHSIPQGSQTKFIYLPSPSPRYGAMSKDEKIMRYREVLPNL
jgi:hypoxanthine-DNA glycosylase